MNPLLELAARRGLFVLEDAAQAHGAYYHGRSWFDGNRRMLQFLSSEKPGGRWRRRDGHDE